MIAFPAKIPGPRRPKDDQGDRGGHDDRVLHYFTRSRRSSRFAIRFSYASMSAVNRASTRARSIRTLQSIIIAGMMSTLRIVLMRGRYSFVTVATSVGT